MNEHLYGQVQQLPEPWIPDAERFYPLDVAARYAGTTRSTLLMYCRWGVIKPVFMPPYGMVAFSEEAIRLVRLGERLRQEEGVNPQGIRIILRLLRLLEQTRT